MIKTDPGMAGRCVFILSSVGSVVPAAFAAAEIERNGRWRRGRAVVASRRRRGVARRRRHGRPRRLRLGRRRVVGLRLRLSRRRRRLVVRRWVREPVARR